MLGKLGGRFEAENLLRTCKSSIACKGTHRVAIRCGPFVGCADTRSCRSSAALVAMSDVCFETKVRIVAGLMSFQARWTVHRVHISSILLTLIAFFLSAYRAFMTSTLSIRGL